MQDRLAKKLACLLERAELLLPPLVPEDGLASKCLSWNTTKLGFSYLQANPDWPKPDLGQLLGLDEEIASLRANTAAFAADRPANHALITGPRGCGKSSLMTGVLGEFIANPRHCGVLISKDKLGDIPTLAAIARRQEKKMLLCCDELSFAGGGEGHLLVKQSLDSIDRHGGHLLLYATSNRRRLMPEAMAENLAAAPGPTGEIHPGESSEEKIALSDRFGLWLPVFSPNDSEYLALVEHWLRRYGLKASAAKRAESLQWARERGSRNGRIAKQFAVDLCVRKRC